mmetsp:Transcript_102302/g.328018  ORF Transcript_102302/g.328018 Transcript_102302/m.328018 type:complete len:218 (-) Transcript_102302:1454-2107(-)
MFLLARVDGVEVGGRRECELPAFNPLQRRLQTMSELVVHHMAPPPHRLNRAEASRPKAASRISVHDTAVDRAVRPQLLPGHPLQDLQNLFEPARMLTRQGHAGQGDGVRTHCRLPHAPQHRQALVPVLGTAMTGNLRVQQDEVGLEAETAELGDETELALPARGAALRTGGKHQAVAKDTWAAELHQATQEGKSLLPMGGSSACPHCRGMCNRVGEA